MISCSVIFKIIRSNFALEPILAGQLEEVIDACIAQEQKRMMEDFNNEVNWELFLIRFKPLLRIYSTLYAFQSQFVL